MTDPLTLAAEAFYRRCPTEIARDGEAIRRKTWEELTGQERFHVVAAMKDAIGVLRRPTDAMVDDGTLYGTAEGAWVAMVDRLLTGNGQ